MDILETDGGRSEPELYGKIIDDAAFDEATVLSEDDAQPQSRTLHVIVVNGCIPGIVYRPSRDVL